jgi:signal transduction histidine kinase
VIRGLSRATSQQPDARQEVCEAARRLLGADADLILVEDGGELVCDASSGIALPPLRVAVDDPRSAIARAYRDQKLVFERRDATELDLLRANGVRAVLAMPITRMGVRIGVCTAVWRSARRRLTDRDRRLAEIVAGEKGVAVQRADHFVHAVELMRAQVRNRLARDLHDSVAQELAVLRVYAETVAGAFRDRPDVLADAVPRLETHAAKAQEEMRALLDALRVGRPVVEANIPDVVDALVADFRTRHRDIDVTVEIPGGDGSDVRPAVRETVYFVLRESLHNASQHAGARSVRVLTRTQPGAISLVVQDDGCGFDPDEPHEGRLGLVGMRERAQLAGGELDVESAPGAGTTVSLRIEDPDRPEAAPV